MVAQWVALPPVSSIVLFLILSSGYCLCGVSHVLTVFVRLSYGFSGVLSPSKTPVNECECVWMVSWNGLASHSGWIPHLMAIVVIGFISTTGTVTVIITHLHSGITNINYKTLTFNCTLVLYVFQGCEVKVTV